MNLRQKLDNAIILKISTAPVGVLILWAMDCAERVIGIFESRCPNDIRCRAAIEAARAFVTREMTAEQALCAGREAQDAAKKTKIGAAAAAAACACAQAAFVPSDPTHAIKVALYALKAVEANNGDSLAERIWQLEDLNSVQFSIEKLLEKYEFLQDIEPNFVSKQE